MLWIESYTPVYHQAGKKGSYKNKLRYRCMECGKQFQNHSRRKQIEKIIWNEYVYQRQTIHQLSEKYKKGKDWIRDRIRNIPTKEYKHTPQLVVIIADVTFFRRSFGILIIRSPHLKKNLYVQEVEHETVDVYRQGRVAFKEEGIHYQGNRP